MPAAMALQVRKKQGSGAPNPDMRLTAFLLCITASGAAMAQKSKVLSAYNYEQAYFSSQDCEQLGKARDAIELALTDEVSSTWAKTWFYRGNIHYDMIVSRDKSCNALSATALDIAHESYMKSLSLDAKKQFTAEIEPRISIIANLYVMRGADNYNLKKYEAALSDFEKALEVAKFFSKTDTAALYNAALSAEKLKNYGKASHYYEGMIDIGSKDARIYHFLAEAYLNSGDSAMAFQTIAAGRKAHPRNQDLIIDELNFYLNKSQNQVALEKLEQAISEMPENAELHFAKGTVYDKINERELARQSYEKALELKPDYFDACYNLGALYFNQGVEFVDLANAYPESEQKKFTEAESKAREYFTKALPYLEKANSLDPHDKSTMISLKNLYSRMDNEEGYKRMSDLLDN